MMPSFYINLQLPWQHAGIPAVLSKELLPSEVPHWLERKGKVWLG
jgi:hypothetical protein